MANKKTNSEAEKQQAAEAPESGEKQSLNLADVQAAVAKMLAEAQAQADAIVANAEAKVKSYIKEDDDAEKKHAKAKAKEENLAWGEERVRIKLFKDAKNYKDDVFVQVNGENCLIKRGETVQIKRKFAEALANSDRQDLAAADLMTELSEQYEEASRKHNM